MSTSPAAVQVAMARFRTVVPGETIEVTVHFNPASLQYTLSNTVEPAPGGRRVQYVSQTTAKLTMDLVFDTTHNGQDVRTETAKMAKFLKPHGPSGRRVPPVVEFSWGTYGFRGTVEQYRETMDFFSPEGVPLRSGINLTLTTNDATFDPNTSGRTSVDGVPAGGAAGAAPQEVANVPVPGAGKPGGAAGLANSLGSPAAARSIAAANGSQSLRFSGGAELAVGGAAGVNLQSAAAFSAGASAGGGIGLGGGIGGGIGGGAGLGLGASGSAGVSLGGLGAAVQGDFSGLRADLGAGVAMPDAATVRALAASSRSEGGGFDIGGRLQAGGSASLAVDVSGDGGLNARLGFGP